MKKIALAAALSVAASSSFAQETVPPVMAETPVAGEVRQASSANGSMLIIVPLLLLLVLAAAAGNA